MTMTQKELAEAIATAESGKFCQKAPPVKQAKEERFAVQRRILSMSGEFTPSQVQGKLDSVRMTCCVLKKRGYLRRVSVAVSGAGIEGVYRVTAHGRRAARMCRRIERIFP